MAANMDTIGTFDMAKEMCKQTLFTAIDKHQTVETWMKFRHENPECIKHVAVSCGISDTDCSKLKEILEAIPEIEFICLDVANGYTESFVQFVRNTREAYPTKTIIVS
jgi:GMP reductase